VVGDCPFDVSLVRNQGLSRTNICAAECQVHRAA
jgi:hypothetical protein